MREICSKALCLTKINARKTEKGGERNRNRFRLNNPKKHKNNARVYVRTYTGVAKYVLLI